MNTVRPVFTDTSVLLNLAFAGCLDLLRGLIGYEFLVPEEVLSEILGSWEHGELRVALQAGFLRRTTMADPGELAVFADLRQFLGIEPRPVLATGRGFSSDRFRIYCTCVSGLPAALSSSTMPSAPSR